MGNSDRLRVILEDLKEKLDGANIHIITEAASPRRVYGGKDIRSLGDDRGNRSKLPPTLSGKIGDRKVSINFAPWSEDRLSLSIFVSERIPFTISITRPEGHLHAFHRLKTPLSDVHSGDADFDRQFVVEGNDVEEVRTFLGDARIRELVQRLGPFERLVIGPKLINLSKMVEIQKEPGADEVYGDISALLAIVERAEAVSAR